MSGEITGDAPPTAVAMKLSRLIQIPTRVRSRTDGLDAATLERVFSCLRESFPLLHQTMNVSYLPRGGILFDLAGSVEEKHGFVMLAHFDVVPASDDSAWRYPAFSGTVAEGAVWGRGALDDKGSLVCLLEAVESLLAGGFRPRVGLYICLGSDEEVDGRAASELREHLLRNGVDITGVIDEGGVIADGIVSFARAPLALIGVAEKGSANIRLQATGKSGHAAMPTRESAANVLARALVRMARRPFPHRRTRTVASFLKALGGAARPPLRALLRFSGPVFPLLAAVLSRTPEVDAMLRTTMAPTVLKAGDAENVLPSRADAVVNVRILAGDSAEDVVDRIRRVVRDARVSVEVDRTMSVTEPSPETSCSDPLFLAVAESVRLTRPDAICAPYLVTATTDSRRYNGDGAPIIRFVPFRLDAESVASIHSENEHVSIENLERATSFYRNLIELVTR